MILTFHQLLDNSFLGVIWSFKNKFIFLKKKEDEGENSECKVGVKTYWMTK